MSEGEFGLVGVILGAIIAGVIPWAQSTWAARNQRLQSARYLAIRVVCSLDNYVEDAVGIVLDDGLSFGQRDQEGCLAPQRRLPEPITYPHEVDWRSIDHGLMYELLSLPNQGEAANNAIKAAREFAGPPDFDEYFEQAQTQYSSLGLKAAELARKLRQAYAIAEPDRSEWNPIEHFEEALRKIDALNQKRATMVPFGEVAA